MKLFEPLFTPSKEKIRYYYVLYKFDDGTPYGGSSFQTFFVKGQDFFPLPDFVKFILQKYPQFNWVSPTTVIEITKKDHDDFNEMLREKFVKSVSGNAQ